jgi:chromosome segregation ATPase
MTWSRSVLSAAAIFALALLAARSADAQVARSGGGSANPQLLQQLQQLASERTSLQAENDKLKKSVEDLTKQLESVKKAQKSIDQRAKESTAALEQSKTQRESTEEQLKQTKDRMEQLIAKFRETAQSLREIEADRTATKQTLSARDQQLKVCIDRNLALYKINEEVLTVLDKQTLWSRVAAAEPFTRIKRNRMENLIDDYKARADDQLVAPAGKTGAAEASPGGKQSAPPSK